MPCKAQQRIVMTSQQFTQHGMPFVCPESPSRQEQGLMRDARQAALSSNPHGMCLTDDEDN